MQKSIEPPAGTVRVGDTIRITGMNAESNMFPDGTDHQAEALNGATGQVTAIDGSGQLFGTWGGLAVIPGVDAFEVIPKTEDESPAQVRIAITADQGHVADFLRQLANDIEADDESLTDFETSYGAATVEWPE